MPIKAVGKIIEISATRTGKNRRIYLYEKDNGAGNRQAHIGDDT